MASQGTFTLLLLWICLFSIIGRTLLAYNRPAAICIDSVYAVQGHTLCIAENKEHPIHQSDRDSIAKIHNDVRAAVNPKASNLLDLEYVTILEKEAQIWAEQCRLDHDEVHLRAVPGRYMVGQNILVSPNPLTWQQVVDEWAKEKVNFQYGQTNNIKLVGNYTQLISAESTAFGCGMSQCNGTYFYVCNYAPSDLASRIKRPYNESISGQGADDCPNHVSNSSSAMCDCGGLMCLNGGTVDLATCKCICPNDDTNMRYDSAFCLLTCRPLTDPAFCQTKDRADCRTDAEVFLACPWKCNACPYAGENYTQGDVTMPWTTTVPTTTTTTTTTTTATTSTNIPISDASTSSAQPNTVTPISASSPVTPMPTTMQMTSTQAGTPVTASPTSKEMTTSLSKSVTSIRRIFTTQDPSGSGLAHSQKGDSGSARGYLRCLTLIGALLVSLIGLT